MLWGIILNSEYDYMFNMSQEKLEGLMLIVSDSYFWVRIKICCK